MGNLGRKAGAGPGRTVVVALAVLAGLAAMSGCAEGFSRNTAVASFNETYPNADRGQSECVVDRLLDRYSLEQLEQELAADPVGAAFEEAQFRDMFACGLEGDVAAEIADQLVANGVGEAHAPCVADALVADLEDTDIDVLLSGQITDAFYQKFFTAMDGCGAVDS